MTTSTDAPEGGALTWNDLLDLPRRGLAVFDRTLAGRWWKATVVAMSTLISLFFAFPSYSKFNSGDKDWQAILHNAQHPFSQKGLIPTDRAYNFTFRVTVPLLGGRLHLTPAGYLVLQGLAGLLIFWAVTTIVHRLTSDRRLAALTSIAVGLTWAGATAFVELRGDFDAVAIALLVAAMATRRWPLVTTLCFLAAWTDERAIPGILLVLAFHHIMENRPDLRIRTLVRERLCWAAAAGLVAHLVTRVIVSKVYDLPAPSNVGLKYVKQYMNLLPAGTWTGLEGFWLWVVIALVVLLHRRQYLMSAGYAAVVLGMITISMSVTDITRSMAYLLPAAFVALAVLVTWCQPKLTRNAIYAAVAMCAAWPLYYAGGESRIYWFYPSFMQVIRKLAGVY